MLHNIWVLAPEVEPTTFPSTLVLARQRELVKRNGASRNCELSHDLRSCDHMMTSFSKLHSCKESILIIIMHIVIISVIIIIIIFTSATCQSLHHCTSTTASSSDGSTSHCTLLHCTIFTALYHYLQCTTYLFCIHPNNF